MREKGATAVTWFRNSDVNGTVAIFRNIAGVPMEREPPAALYTKPRPSRCSWVPHKYPPDFEIERLQQG